MDLRIVKTRKSIREAFLTLRRNRPLEKIKVSELCELALINKATFYKHYEDIYALSAELDNELMDRVLADFSERDCLFSDPDSFLTGLPKAMDANQDLLVPLFDDRFDLFFTMLIPRLRALYPEEQTDPERNVRLTFILTGAFGTLREHLTKGEEDETGLTQRIAEMIRRCSGN